MKKVNVAIQGLKGSFHHEAAIHFFGEGVEVVECETFREVVSAAAAAQVDFALMAIENSLAGSIIPNYALLRSFPVEIHGEVGLRVKMNLMALPGVKMEQIEEVHTHQMAIRQCEGFFENHPKLKVIEAFDTAGSAKMISDKKIKNSAAIASVLAARQYGMEILEAGIEDHDLNYTRFLILKQRGAGAVEHPNKLSVYFQTRHEAGSLSEVLTVISAIGINLGKLQSHPVPSKNALYGFYATLEIQELSQINDLVTLMDRMTIQFEILGKYKKGTTHG